MLIKSRRWQVRKSRYFFVSKEKLKEMSDGGVHQGFVLKTSAYAYKELSDLLALTEDAENPLLIVIDGLTDLIIWVVFLEQQTRLVFRALLSPSIARSA